MRSWWCSYLVQLRLPVGPVDCFCWTTLLSCWQRPSGFLCVCHPGTEVSQAFGIHHRMSRLAAPHFLLGCKTAAPPSSFCRSLQSLRRGFAPNTVVGSFLFRIQRVQAFSNPRSFRFVSLPWSQLFLVHFDLILCRSPRRLADVQGVATRGCDSFRRLLNCTACRLGLLLELRV